MGAGKRSATAVEAVSKHRTAPRGAFVAVSSAEAEPFPLLDPNILRVLRSPLACAAQVWIWPLSIVVALFPFLILYDPLGIIGLVNIVVILAGNVPLLVHYRGFVKAMGIAHVPGMCVIVVYGCMRFAGPVGDELQISPDVFEPRELFGVALSMVVVSGISLIFDVVDSFLWISGRNREVSAQTSASIIRVSPQQLILREMFNLAGAAGRHDGRNHDVG